MVLLLAAAGALAALPILQEPNFRQKSEHFCLNRI